MAETPGECGVFNGAHKSASASVCRMLLWNGSDGTMLGCQVAGMNAKVSMASM